MFQFGDVFISQWLAGTSGNKSFPLSLIIPALVPVNLSNEGTLTVDDGVQVGHILAQVLDFLGHGYAGRGNMVTLAELNADAGIDHVFPAAEGTADTEHGVFIGTVVSTDSGRIGATVIAVAAAKSHLSSGSKSSGWRAAKAAAPAPTRLMRLPNLLTEPLRPLIAWSRCQSWLPLTHRSNPADLARCNAFNLVAAHVDSALLDGNVLMAAVASLDGKATVVHSRVARSHTVQTFEVFSQTDVQRIINTFDDANIVFFADIFRFDAALDFQGIAHAYFDIFLIIALEYASAVDLIADGLQLVFRSSPAVLDVLAIPFLVVQSVQVVPFFRVTITSRISLFAQNHSVITSTDGHLAFGTVHGDLIGSVPRRDFGAVAVDGNLFGCIRFITEGNVVIQIDRVVVFHGDVLAALGLDRISRLTGFVSGDFLHIADAGRIVVLGIGILLAVDAASDVGDLLGSAVDA